VTRRSTQAKLGEALSHYLGRVDRRGDLVRARIADVWEKAVGPDIARHTAGVHFRDGELVVYVDTPVWATELTALSQQLAESINEQLGQETVGSIRFTVSKKVSECRSLEAAAAEDEVFYNEDDVDSVELAQDEVDQVRQSASVIRNEELREAVIRATIKDLEWKRGLAGRHSKSGP
jgi:hypothetical protein